LTAAAADWYNQLPMAVQPVADDRRLAHEAVYERLLGQVLDGRLAAGGSLPSERALAEEHGVNRHAVREAIKRLQQAGLVAVSQGGATRVRDWRASAGLDLLVALAGVARGAQHQALLRDIAEMRATVATDVARRCAQRAPGAAPAVVDDRAPFGERAAAYVAFWAALVDGAGNVAYRLAFNTLVAAQLDGPIDPALYAAEIDDAPAQRALLEAIAAGDGAEAAARAAALLERTVEALA
jgi:DNA-binding FadR family transcriptional regulator